MAKGEEEGVVGKAQGRRGHCGESPLEKLNCVCASCCLVKPVLVSFPAPLCEPDGELCFPVFLTVQGVPCHHNQHTRLVDD